MVSKLDKTKILAAVVAFSFGLAGDVLANGIFDVKCPVLAAHQENLALTIDGTGYPLMDSDRSLRYLWKIANSERVANVSSSSSYNSFREALEGGYIRPTGVLVNKVDSEDLGQLVCMYRGLDLVLEDYSCKAVEVRGGVRGTGCIHTPRVTWLTLDMATGEMFPADGPTG